MPSPLVIQGFQAKEIRDKIALISKNLVNIKDDSGHYLLKLPDGRLLDTRDWNDWDWTHGVGLYGMWQYHALTGSNVSLRLMTDWFRARLAEGTTKHINTMAVFLTLAYLYEEVGEMSYLPWLDSWAEWAINDLPRTKYGGFQHVTYLRENKNQLWTDTLMMAVLPLAKIGKLLNRPRYLEEAKKQFLIHCQYLFDSKTGLFFHGWQFDESAPGGVGHNFANARWARGNAWCAIAMADFIELLDVPTSNPIRAYLSGILESQVNALRMCQREDGLWGTLLDYGEEDGSYVEAAASAGFAYAILKSVRKRFISAEYKEVGFKAIKGLVTHISEDGELREVSLGTPIGTSLEHYKKVERASMPHGQAMAILALAEFTRQFI